MNPNGRPGLTPAQKRDLWQRWKDGQSLSEIARALGKHPGSIHGVVKANGGIVPATRTRGARSLTSAEREEISRGLAQGESMRAIAARMRRAPSTISREIVRHGGRSSIGHHTLMFERGTTRSDRSGVYCPPTSSSATLSPRSCPTTGRLNRSSGWLRGAYADDDTMRVSPETIYRSLFLQARGVLDKQLVTRLRRVRTMRSSRNASIKGQGRGQIVGAVSIRGQGRRGRRPARPRPLGGRPDHRLRQQPHRHPGREAFPIRAAGQGRRQGH